MTLDDIQVNPAAVRDPRIIQMLHDLLLRLLTGTLPTGRPMPLTAPEELRLAHFASVLCWVLGHDAEPGARFREDVNALLDRVEKELEVPGGPLM